MVIIYLLQAPFARPGGLANEIAGVVYVYKHQNDGQWKQTQILSMHGIWDHLGNNQVDSQGKWLMVSLIGTPTGINDTNLAYQDFKGAVVIYKLDEASSEWKLFQILDSNTPGLEDLSSSIGVFELKGASFGLNFSLDANNERLMVGAEYQNVLDSNDNLKLFAGAVYAFKFNHQTNKWELTQKISNPEGPINDDAFGANLRIYDDMAIITNGIYINHPKSVNTAAYVYHLAKGQWEYVQKLTSDLTAPVIMPRANPFTKEPLPSAPMSDVYGGSLAMSKDWALIGSVYESKSTIVNTASGAIYFYKLDRTENQPKYVLMQKEFSPIDPQAFGTGLVNIDIQGNLALISDSGTTGSAGAYQGAALVYQLQNGHWDFVQALTDPNSAQYSFFGGSVSIDGNRVAVGGGTLIGLRLSFDSQANIGPETGHDVLLDVLPMFSIITDRNKLPVIIYEKSAQ